MPISNWSRQQRAAALFALGLVTTYLLLFLLQHGKAKIDQTFSYTLQLGPHLFAMLCNLAYACYGRHSSVTRQRGWLLLGLTGMAYTIGDLIYFYYAGVRRVPVPFPGLDDFFWLLSAPLLLSGVLALFGSLPNAGRARLLLDSAIACSSLAALWWYFLIERIWQQSGISMAGKLVSVFAPVGDIAALFGATVLLNSPTTNQHLRRSLLCLSGGIMLWAFADVVYCFARLHNAFQDGAWTDLGWPSGSLLIGLAALVPYCRQDDLSIEGSLASKSFALPGVPRLVSMFLPYLASMGAFAVISLHDCFTGAHKVSNSTLLIGLFMLLLVVVRQVFTLLENRHLTTQLIAFNETLEHRVTRRTEQLSALLHINTAVNNTLKVDEVLLIAREQTQLAYQADAIIIWLADEQADEPEANEHKANEHEAKTICSLSLPVSSPITKSMLCGSELAPDVRAALEQMPIRAITEQLQLPTPSETTQLTAEKSPPGPAGDAAGSDGAGYCLRAPLMWRQRLRGMIGVIRRHTGFEPADADLLQNIGLGLATALENARLYGEALDAADCDPVTGLLNHRAMHQRLDTALEQARFTERAVAVMMLDLNNFKLFNDTYGHPVGDQVLRRVAAALRSECPSHAILGRYGGDEFIVVIPDMPVETSIRIAESVRKNLMAEGFRRAHEERVIPITLCFGIATFPDDSSNRHELLTIADKNLYSAKSQGEGISCSTAFQRTNRELRTETSFDILDAMITAVDNKDRYTRQHSEDVTEYALWIGEEIGLSEESKRILRIGGLLHDVGKIGVPDEILRKPGRLTDEEFASLKRHPHLGALIVGSIPGMEPMLDVVRSHHERWDGKGYPDGLAGEAIPLLGRITAVADAVSAMTTHRPYRRGLEWQVAMEEVSKHAKTQFDPALAEAFLRAARHRHPIISPASESEKQELPKAA